MHGTDIRPLRQHGLAKFLREVLRTSCFCSPKFKHVLRDCERYAASFASVFLLICRLRQAVFDTALKPHVQSAVLHIAAQICVELAGSCAARWSEC